MLGLRLNHVSKRGYWWRYLASIPGMHLVLHKQWYNPSDREPALGPAPKLYFATSSILQNSKLVNICCFCINNNGAIVVACAKMWPDFITRIKIRTKQIFPLARIRIMGSSTWSTLGETGPLRTPCLIKHTHTFTLFYCGDSNRSDGLTRYINVYPLNLLQGTEPTV